MYTQEQLQKLGYDLFGYANYGKQSHQWHYPCDGVTIGMFRQQNSITITLHDHREELSRYLKIRWRGSYSDISAYNAAKRILSYL